MVAPARLEEYGRAMTADTFQWVVLVLLVVLVALALWAWRRP
jgi:hypothetical protein